MFATWNMSSIEVTLAIGGILRLWRRHSGGEVRVNHDECRAVITRRYRVPVS